MSTTGYSGPTIEGVFHATTAELLIPALAVAVPLWVLARTLRHYHALRTFGTTHLTRGQNLTLDRGHSLLRRLSQTITAITIVLGALLIQNGLVREFVQGGMPLGIGWRGF